MPDWIRHSVGTLSIIRVQPPREVNSSIAAKAMLAAPLVALLLAIPAALLLTGVAAVAPPGTLTALLAASLTTGLLAWLTRGMHLDGLADTADGLGSGKSGTLALEIMRKSDTGPFGVVTLTVILLLQVTALAIAIETGRGVIALAIALVTSRVALPLTCRSGIAAARPNGLGATVAGSVTKPAAFTATLAVGAIIGALAFVFGNWREALVLGAIYAAALTTSALLTRRCAQRFGGITGDVLGAVVEVAFTVSLVGFALFA